MLSFGTELPFALAIASASVGLPAGSPPPMRAATSTFLMSFAKSLPRRASTTAFLCFVVAHFEWPLTPQFYADLPRTKAALRHKQDVTTGFRCGCWVSRHVYARMPRPTVTLSDQRS